MSLAGIRVILPCIVSVVAISVSADLHPNSVALHSKQITGRADYDRWRTIEHPLLSGDGTWVAYTLAAADGSIELIVRSLDQSLEFRVDRGMRSRVNSLEDFDGRSGHRIPATEFTANSRSVIFTVYPSPANAAASKTDTQINYDGESQLGIMSLPDGVVTRIPDAKRFVLPRNSVRFIAYETGRGFVLRDLDTGTQAPIPDAQYVAFDARALNLAYVSTSNDPSRNGVFIRRLEDGSVSPILVGRGEYSALTFGPQEGQLAFLSTQDKQAKVSTGYSLYYMQSATGTVTPVVRASTLKSGVQISLESRVKFTSTGDALVFTLSPVADARTDESGGESGASFDLWRWNDPESWQQREHMRSNGPSKSFLSIYHINKNRRVQLSSERVQTVILTNDGRRAIGVDQSPYSLKATWGERIADVYSIDVLSGSARLIKQGFRTGEWLPVKPFRLSPGGRYLLYFENRRWFSYDFVTGDTVDLTGGLLPDVSFDLEYSYQQNRPSLPSGIAGWTGEDRRVLIYDRHDVWAIDPAGVEKPIVLTGGFGQRMNIVFSIWPHDWRTLREFISQEPIEETLDEAKPVLLSAYSRESMATGLWQAGIGSSKDPKLMVMRDKRVTLLATTEEPTRYLVTQETFTEFPDLWAGRNLDSLTRVSDANPHQQEYRWGSAELVGWTSRSGMPLKGVLYTPEGFDPERKYPMIVHIYSLWSHELHAYHAPEPESSAYILSPAKYLSQGYVVFLPDIINSTPYPAESALASVVPGVQTLIEHGFVDPSRVCLTGHSWGGYQAAYIISRTDLFRCAIESAGEANTLSGYSGLLSNGRVRSFMYEHGAALHGSSIWENPFIYLANSPFLFADRVHTPLLMMHNEKDGAVPFAQGVELYVALRRNSKEAYFYNYIGEDHQLFRYVNRLDWDRRVQEFLDHYLKDAPKPSWMDSGIKSAADKSITRKRIDLSVPHPTDLFR